MLSLARCALVLCLIGYGARFAESYSLPSRHSSQDVLLDVGDNVYFRQKMSSWKDDKCAVFDNESLHSVLDRVCLMCHEMFSHERANMRYECRQNCFNNQLFAKCLRLFAPPSRTKREIRELESIVTSA